MTRLEDMRKNALALKQLSVDQAQVPTTAIDPLPAVERIQDVVDPFCQNTNDVPLPFPAEEQAVVALISLQLSLPTTQPVLSTTVQPALPIGEPARPLTSFPDFALQRGANHCYSPSCSTHLNTVYPSCFKAIYAKPPSTH
eukprot:CAMPEP_0181288488 /NCGR_PEP_ID=MMETSP1101-20121128/358_1 /TAXON_ID=46948 /ORGANISM="Rhodomonas abbreviata, Strain Caron Lab Isolate" /LENGTH=140 /DNA_ID=CAMNT_0023392611 /DNA_START=6 /DNA_END=429 /DNA_ORIENTATION=-